MPAHCLHILTQHIKRPLDEAMSVATCIDLPLCCVIDCMHLTETRARHCVFQIQVHKHSCDTPQRVHMCHVKSHLTLSALDRAEPCPCVVHTFAVCMCGSEARCTVRLLALLTRPVIHDKHLWQGNMHKGVVRTRNEAC